MNLIYHPFNLELNHSFAISRWTYTHTQSLIVEIRDQGISGFGEATHNPYYPNTEIDFMTNRLKSIEKDFLNLKNKTPQEFWNIAHALLVDCPFALCALDEAYHDWFSKRQDIPLYQYWGLSLDHQPTTCYTLSIDEIDVMVERMRKTPWNIYKIKLGTQHDIEIVEALRKHTGAGFWVDANCAWTVEETIEKSKELHRLGVEFIEQPLAADQWEAMEEVFQKSTLPIFADESCKTYSDIEKCKNRFHGINIKAMKCGGLVPARKMIQKARSLQLKVMVGCMAESTVGISAIAHLSPLIDYADMDGQYFIKNDPAEGVKVTKDGFVFPNRNGTGVVFKK
jgi:L-Ala-D/L-Glu epimerase / N-acetyl-D-glutamate racemase